MSSAEKTCSVERNKSEKTLKDDSSKYLVCGLGLGGFATASLILTGAACPMCLIATPALIATGIYKKLARIKK